MVKTTMTGAVLLALVLVLGPSAAAGKGGSKGKPGGGGDDPAPTCAEWVYALWHKKGQPVTGLGLARVCTDGGATEQLTDEIYGWSALEASPDGGHLVGFKGSETHLVDLAAADTPIAFGEDVPLGDFPTWSWRVDTSGVPLAAEDQFVAVRRPAPVTMALTGTTFVNDEIYAFHPIADADDELLVSFPTTYTETVQVMVDPSTDSPATGTKIDAILSLVLDTTWLAGDPATPDTSWIVFWLQQERKTADVFDDDGVNRYENVVTTEIVEGWYVQEVETGIDAQGDAYVAAVGSPQELVAAGDSDIDVRERNIRFSKFGTHVLWEHTKDTGFRWAEITYDNGAPEIDVSTIENLDSDVVSEFGALSFGNLALSHDASRLAMGVQCEVWIMDLATGASTLERISPRSRNGKPCYGVALTWSE